MFLREDFYACLGYIYLIKNTIKEKYLEMLLPFNIIVFYLNIF